MEHIQTTATEEQIRFIIELTKAPRQEVLQTIKISKVNIGNIIACLQKIQHYDNPNKHKQRKKQGH